MSVQDEVDEIMFGRFGLGPDVVAQVIRAEVKAWTTAAGDDPEHLRMVRDTLYGVCTSLGHQFAGRNPAFSYTQFTRDCGL